MAVQAAIRNAVRGRELSSCHDIAEGGLLVAEASLAGAIGVQLTIGELAALFS